MLYLHSYYRSSASYRVRIALNYKQLAFTTLPVNLLKGEQRQEAFRQQNLQGRVPLLDDNGFKLGQSSAILEYLEEKYPQQPLLPKGIEDRAWIRYLSQIIISDVHPLNNLGVTKYITEHYGQTPEDIQKWYHHWMSSGFDCLEALLANHPQCGNFCWGDTPTFADLCLIPQIYNAKRFNLPMENYPTLSRINDYCLSLAYFDEARPERQPDCPEQQVVSA